MQTEPKHERPIVTVDVIIATLRDDHLHVLMMRRPKAPFEGCWSLPGGYVHVDEDESTEDAARRVLGQKLGIEALHIEQLATYSGPTRDPRGWSVSIGYLALVPPAALDCITSDDACFFPVSGQGAKTALAFDHSDILADAVKRIEAKATYSLLPAALIGEEFTLPELKSAYDALLHRELNDSAFRRKFLSLGVIEECGTRPTDKRPARLYRLVDGMQTFDRALVDPA